MVNAIRACLTRIKFPIKELDQPVHIEDDIDLSEEWDALWKEYPDAIYLIVEIPD